MRGVAASPLRADLRGSHVAFSATAQRGRAGYPGNEPTQSRCRPMSAPIEPPSPWGDTAARVGRQLEGQSAALDARLADPNERHLAELVGQLCQEELRQIRAAMRSSLGTIHNDIEALTKSLGRLEQRMECVESATRPVLDASSIDRRMCELEDAADAAAEAAAAVVGWLQAGGLQEVRGVQGGLDALRETVALKQLETEELSGRLSAELQKMEALQLEQSGCLREEVRNCLQKVEALQHEQELHAKVGHCLTGELRAVWAVLDRPPAATSGPPAAPEKRRCCFSDQPPLACGSVDGQKFSAGAGAMSRGGNGTDGRQVYFQEACPGGGGGLKLVVDGSSACSAPPTVVATPSM
eukprot:gnl/TRDRNA2_/TRDRNA2_157043_c0_seq1.p1 gnl/TRDRNA2_/TRDRNA2_157043_c0~~gnl/TRDRNA2_/TRDRNA2_157043_c0_seq1.p1  ORF type:complete len:354 (-),score=72.20 gnl/TRDRNA2_/TRDRNA2_157043_c0_seq1:25-1086(-)